MLEFSSMSLYHLMFHETKPIQSTILTYNSAASQQTVQTKWFKPQQFS